MVTVVKVKVVNVVVGGTQLASVARLRRGMYSLGHQVVVRVTSASARKGIATGGCEL